MAPVAGCHDLNPRVALNRRYRKHGVGYEGIVLCRNNKRGDRDGSDDMARAHTIIVVGSAGVSPVRGSIAMVELAHADRAVEIRKIPLAREERRLSS